MQAGFLPAAPVATAICHIRGVSLVVRKFVAKNAQSRIQIWPVCEKEAGNRCPPRISCPEIVGSLRQMEPILVVAGGLARSLVLDESIDRLALVGPHLAAVIAHNNGPVAGRHGKRTDNVDTYAYFGEPVYTYSLREGIEDGYLTPFRVRQYSSTVDAYTFDGEDKVVSGEVADGTTFEEKDFNKIVRMRARELHRVRTFLGEINRTEKTLVFCATQAHAALIRDLTNQEASSPDLCLTITAEAIAPRQRISTLRTAALAVET